jgi:hypothetical protein
LLGFFTAIGSALVVYFSKGMLALDALDFWGGTMLLFVLATIQALLYGWVLGIERGERAAHEGAHMRIPHFVQFMLKYVSPAFLLIVFAGTIITKKPDDWKTLASAPAARISFGFICLVLLLLLTLIHIAGRRWQAAGKLSETAPERDGAK